MEESQLKEMGAIFEDAEIKSQEIEESKSTNLEGGQNMEEVQETQVDFENMEVASVTNDNAKDFLAHHVSKVKDQAQSLTVSHMTARDAFTKNILEIGSRVKKMCEVFKAHRDSFEGTWRDYFNDNFPAKFYRSAEDYKRLAGISDIGDFTILGKDRLLTVVKTFKGELEHNQNPITMATLFERNNIDFNNLDNYDNAEKFINAVDVMVVKSKFSDHNIDNNKLVTVIGQHKRYTKLVRGLKKVVNNNGNVDDYLDAIIDGDSQRIRSLEGRNDDSVTNNTGAANETETAITEIPATPNQVVEEVKTYISEKKGLLQSAAGENSDQYSAVINLMEQLEDALSRLNVTDRQAA